MSKSLEALKKIWHYAIQEHNNLFINDVFDNCYMPIKQDLELLGSLQQIWNNQEFCKGIPLSADGLNSLFNYNLDMFNKNLELDKKVLDLEKENQELKDTGILQLLTNNAKYQNDNQVLQQTNEKLKKAICTIQDDLIDKKDKRHNELVGYLPKVEGLIAKVENETDIPQALLDISEKYNYPIIML